MKPIAHRAHVALDLAAAGQDGFIRPHQVFEQFGFEVVSGLNSAGVELILQTDQKHGSVGNGMRWNPGG